MVWICAYRDWAKKIYTEVNLKTPCILIQTLKEFKRLSESLQPLTRGLNEQPNMLIFDKSLPADPKPRKQ